MSTFDGVIREYPSIVVDRFIAHRDGAHHHFLSHAHADHMVGLPCKKWPSSMPIYCSVGTARVLRGLGGGRYRSMLRHLV